MKKSKNYNIEEIEVFNKYLLNELQKQINEFCISNERKETKNKLKFSKISYNQK